MPKLRILCCIPSVSAMESYQSRLVCIFHIVRNYMEDVVRSKTVDVEGVEAQRAIAAHLFAVLMK